MTQEASGAPSVPVRPDPLGEVQATSAEALHLTPRRVFILAVFTACTLALASTAAITAWYLWPGLQEHWLLGSAYKALNADLEHNLPSLASVFGLLACALLMFVTARILRGTGSPGVRHWAGLGAVFLVMSLDEGMGMHETLMPPLRAAFNFSGWFHFSWVVPGLAFVALIAAAYFKLWWRLPGVVRTLVFAAACLYVGGALGVELIDGRVASLYGEHNLTYQLLTTVEEFMEMLGIATLLYALLTYLRHLTGNHPLRFTLDAPR